MLPPAGGRHGRIAVQVAFLLKAQVQGKSLGVAFAAETGFEVRASGYRPSPDVAFVKKPRYAGV